MTLYKAKIDRHEWDDDSCYWAIDQLDAARVGISSELSEDHITIMWRDDDSVDTLDAIFGLQDKLHRCKYSPKLSLQNTYVSYNKGEDND